MQLHRLNNSLALRVKHRAAEFLNAYTTNSLNAPRNAFVNLRGQIVCVCDQMVISPEKMILVIEKQFIERLQTHLVPYLKLYETVIEPAPEFKIYFDLEGDREPERGEIFVPRQKGLLIGTTDELMAGVSDEAFRWFRVKNNIPVQGIDFDEELLLNVADEEFVSYTKGCYLGQEIIARVHHRAKPPKKLVVKSLDECSPEEATRMTSKCVDPDTGKMVGFIFINNS